MKKYYLTAMIFAAVLITTIVLLAILLKPEGMTVETIKFDDGEIEKPLEEVSFNVKVPEYMPNSFVYEEALITEVDGEQMMLSLLFKDNQQYISLSASESSEPLEKYVELDTNWNWRKTKVSGENAFIGTSNDLLERKLVYKEDGVDYELTSTIDAKELVNIAESLK